jgi:hypothetical protein
MSSFLEESGDVVIFSVKPTVNQARKPSFIYYSLYFSIFLRSSQNLGNECPGLWMSGGKESSLLESKIVCHLSFLNREQTSHIGGRVWNRKTPELNGQYKLMNTNYAKTQLTKPEQIRKDSSSMNSISLFSRTLTWRFIESPYVRFEELPKAIKNQKDIKKE